MDTPRYTQLPDPMPPHQAAQKEAVETSREVIIIGGGLAGLSAAIYLGRAMRDVLLVDAGESLALWEPHVQNYLGFPDGIHGKDLLQIGRQQAERFGAGFCCDEIDAAQKIEQGFHLRGKKQDYRCRKLLLATGVYHLPPKIPEADNCIGKSMFFCKDCDGYRVQGKRVAIIGANNEAVRYALGILSYTEKVTLLTNGEPPRWKTERSSLLKEFQVPIFHSKIVHTRHDKGQIQALELEDGQCIFLDCLFTTRGDVFHNTLARQLGAKLDEEGQVIVDTDQRTNIPGLYAAGCVTPANCQMIIAAGNGATAAQAINTELFDECLATGELRSHRTAQLRKGTTQPDVVNLREGPNN